MRLFWLIFLLALPVSTVWGQQLSGDSSSMVAGHTLASPASPGGGGNGGHGTPASAEEHTAPFSGLAVGVKVGLLGVGVEAATPLASTLNLRAGGNFFGYSDNLTHDQVHYDADLRFRSAEASLDWFPGAHGFHVSPGALLYNGNKIAATAAVSGGTTFTLNNVRYLSDAANPVTGSGSLTFNKAAPKVTVGFGNMIPRSGRHISFPLELGVAYAGKPKVALNLMGTVCDPSGLNCTTIGASSAVQANVAGEQTKISHDVAPARFYPLLSPGVAFSF
jgi:hypothetical protein